MVWLLCDLPVGSGERDSEDADNEKISKKEKVCGNLKQEQKK